MTVIKYSNFVIPRKRFFVKKETISGWCFIMSNKYRIERQEGDGHSSGRSSMSLKGHITMGIHKSIVVNAQVFT